MVLGGLIQQDSSLSLQRIPLLGALPILGPLFQKRKEIQENTELVIYILPCREDREEGAAGSSLERYYEKYGA